MNTGRRLVFLSILCLALPGCLEDNPEELDRLVKEDPVFRRMIAARDESRGHIRAIKRDLLERKKAVDAQIGKLRFEYDAYAKAQNQKIEEQRTAIERHRVWLKKELEVDEASLTEKEAELKRYQAMAQEARGMLPEYTQKEGPRGAARGKPGFSLTKTERDKLREHLLMLSEKRRYLSDEVQELKNKIRLKKQKIGYLH